MSNEIATALDAGVLATADRSMLTEADRADIQALVLFGTKSPCLRYHFYEIGDAEGARRFISELLQPGVLAINTAAQAQQDRTNLVYLALTFVGLQKLGMPKETLGSFPEEFRAGARRRAIDVIGDATEASTQRWDISDELAHLVVMLYARDGQNIIDRSTDLNRLAEQRGCRLVRYLDAQSLPDFAHPSGQYVTRPSHFGFSDGISQPAIKGEAQGAPGPPAVMPGAFLLGHPAKNQAETQHPPLDPPELSLNGTFGALRILEQDCDAFEEFLERQPGDAYSRELLAAQMCGRWRNGVSLTVSPDTPDPPGQLAPHDLNNFDYVPTANHPLAADDRRGQRCPIGSHARRANPRNGDTSGSMGEKIRLIRRGMPYGPPHVRGDGRSRGTLGLFLCASLKHQFEFVMRNWLGDGLFARGLNPAETDPFVGVSDGDRTFTSRRSEGEASVVSMPTFVTTRGAAYLFFPSVTALRMLAEGTVQSAPRALPVGGNERRAEPVPPPLKVPGDADSDAAHLEFVIANIKNRVGSSINRDAHPKHHGIVKGEFVIGGNESDPEERGRRERLAHGLFKDARSYKCYLRFSNGNPVRTTFDGVPDLRGLAIKIFGVDQDTLIGRRGTHDFILASDSRFFVKNLRDYTRFLTTPPGPAQLKAFPILAQALRSHENPLAVRYFSQSPYACGPQHVKYAVMPVSLPPEDRPVRFSPDEIVRRGPDYLREAMAATLAGQDVLLRFMVQFAPEGTDLDDATVEWKTPFTAVAEIKIPRQEFRASQQMELAERISFNPWNVTEAHRPMGSINETRRHVYLAISALRHENAHVTFVEPTGNEL